jgi:hypothetical protein
MTAMASVMTDDAMQTTNPKADLDRRIAELERRGRESALAAAASTDPEARLYNTSLARELAQLAAQLRRQRGA